MFPGPRSQIIYNDAGEVLGWDEPADELDFWCDDCGISHTGFCVDYDYDEEDDNE